MNRREWNTWVELFGLQTLTQINEEGLRKLKERRMCSSNNDIKKADTEDQSVPAKPNHWREVRLDLDANRATQSCQENPCLRCGHAPGDEIEWVVDDLVVTCPCTCHRAEKVEIIDVMEKAIGRLQNAVVKFSEFVGGMVTISHTRGEHQEHIYNICIYDSENNGTVFTYESLTAPSETFIVSMLVQCLVCCGIPTETATGAIELALGAIITDIVGDL